MNQQEEAKRRIMVALDVATLDDAERLAATLAPFVGGFKVGTPLLSTVGVSAIVERLRPYGSLFLDGKFNDIPSVVATCVRRAADLGVDMLSIHALAGEDAIRAAVRARGKTEIIGLTVLTSLTDEQCRIYLGNNAWSIIIRLAQLLYNEGVDGILSSPEEAVGLFTHINRSTTTWKPRIIVAGIRPTWASTDDHARTATPWKAIRSGADRLIIGRPIIAPPSTIGTPVDAVQRILEEVADALRGMPEHPSSIVAAP